MALTSNYQKHKSKNPLKKFLINNFFNVLLGFLKGIDIDSILDVGCGEGFTLGKLKEHGIGKKHTGIDAAKDAIVLGKKENPNLNLSIGDIYNLKFKDKSFDLVISTEVLEHLADPKKALRELKRISKKYVLLSVPNEPWFYLFNYTQWGKDIGHINKWTKSAFVKLIKSQGLKVVKSETPFPWTLILCKIKSD
jgi:ubiquinone/menaquinone biosynthesis C-methylase UbiE